MNLFCCCLFPLVVDIVLSCTDRRLNLLAADRSDCVNVNVKCASCEDCLRDEGDTFCL